MCAARSHTALDGRPRPPTECTASSSSISINRTARVYRGSAALRRPAVVGSRLVVGLPERRYRRRPVGKPGNRLCGPPVGLREASWSPRRHAALRGYVERLALVHRPLADVRRQFERVVRQFVEAAPVDETDSPADADPDPSDAAILLSMPGIDAGVVATLVVQRRLAAHGRHGAPAVPELAGCRRAR